jgi:hypothetical protein
MLHPKTRPICLYLLLLALLVIFGCGGGGSDETLPSALSSSHSSASETKESPSGSEIVSNDQSPIGQSSDTALSGQESPIESSTSATLGTSVESIEPSVGTSAETSAESSAQSEASSGAESSEVSTEPAEVDQTASKVTAATECLTDGQTSVIITVTPIDLAGQQMGKGLAVQITASTGNFTGPVMDRGDGNYQRALVYEARILDITISAKVNNVALKQQPQILFRPKANLLGGTGGCPLKKKLDVVLLDAVSGDPIKGGIVMAGPKYQTPFEGNTAITDQNGKASLSNDALLGPMVVTVGASGYQIVTFTAFNASELVMPLQPVLQNIPERYTVKGNIANYEDNTNDVYCGFATPRMDAERFFSFTKESILAPQTKMQIGSLPIDAPGNFVCPKQSVTFGIAKTTLTKDYQMEFLPQNTEITVIAGTLPTSVVWDLAQKQFSGSASEGDMMQIAFGKLSYDSFRISDEVDLPPEQLALNVKNPRPLTMDFNVTVNADFPGLYGVVDHFVYNDDLSRIYLVGLGMTQENGKVTMPSMDLAGGFENYRTGAMASFWDFTDWTEKKSGVIQLDLASTKEPLTLDNFFKLIPNLTASGSNFSMGKVYDEDENDPNLPYFTRASIQKYFDVPGSYLIDGPERIYVDLWTFYLPAAQLTWEMPTLPTKEQLAQAPDALPTQLPLRLITRVSALEGLLRFDLNNYAFSAYNSNFTRFSEDAIPYTPPSK